MSENSLQQPLAVGMAVEIAVETVVEVVELLIFEWGVQH